MSPLPPRPGHGAAPGRVNLIGDHTDYNAGLALPMALDLRCEVRFDPAPGRRLVVRSDAFIDPVVLALGTSAEPGTLEPSWIGLVAALWEELGLDGGGTLEIHSDVPVGAGLSSSAALGVAVAAAAGVPLEPWALARTCQRAEARVGASVGLMDPVVAVAARAGHALLIDFADSTFRLVPTPFGPSGEAEVVVVHSGEARRLAGSPYGERRRQCEEAASRLGTPLGRAGPDDAVRLEEPLRSRARHVVTECRRVQAFADALGRGDLAGCGRLLDESHESLRRDFEVTTPTVDALVAELRRQPGVLGARMTGGGFGGCVIALSAPGALDLGRWPGRAWRVRPSDGAAPVGP